MKLYDLVIDNGCSISPYVWRIKYALAHKGVSYDAVPVGFVDIPGILGGGFKTVPVLEADDRVIGDSWAIADFLDQAYPERPLFTSAQHRALVRFFDTWFLSEVARRMFGLCVKDIHDRCRPQDQAYFRQSRERSLGGQSLEAFTAGREERTPELREALSPLRHTLSTSPWICGDDPGYADYIVLGGFLWIGSVTSLPPLQADDLLTGWLERGFDLYGGLGRDPRLQPLVV